MTYGGTRKCVGAVADTGVTGTGVLIGVEPVPLPRVLVGLRGKNRLAASIASGHQKKDLQMMAFFYTEGLRIPAVPISDDTSREKRTENETAVKGDFESDAEL